MSAKQILRSAGRSWARRAGTGRSRGVVRSPGSLSQLPRWSRICAQGGKRLGAGGILGTFLGLCLSGCAVEIPITGHYEAEGRRSQGIITENTERIFGQRLNLEDIAISRWRETFLDSEAVREICIKATRDANNSVNATSTYIARFRGDQIIQSQAALAEHGCEEETYVPLVG